MAPDSRDDPTRTASLWAPAAAQKRLEHCVLHVVHPAELATQPVLGRRRTILGRRPDAAEAGVEVVHSTVSRQHAAVEWSARDGAHVVWDLGSSNGTWLDGDRLDDGAVTLQHGAVIRLGDVLVVYERAADDGAQMAQMVSLDEVPGASAAVTSLRTQVGLAGMDPSAVLVLGETGTGKERIASEIHRLSGRSGGFFAVNCAALAATLVESQLFGHVKGAFTGATAAQKGLFRDADGGTLFLDEVGELPLELQAKLLRVLQEREVMPLGSSQTYSVDVRVVAATNADVIGLVETGGFRRDLYARLAMWEVTVPPLRDRRADVIAWGDRLFARWAAERGVAAPAHVPWTAAAAQRLLVAPWDDNLRGVDRLVHAVAHRAVQGAPIDEIHLPAWLGQAPAVEPPPKKVRRKPEPVRPKPPIPSAEEFRAFMEAHDHSVRAAARHFQRDRRQIYRWVDRFGVRKPGTE